MALSIRHKSVALFLICALVPAFAVAVSGYQTARQALSQFLESDLATEAREAIERVESFLAEAQTDVKSWSRVATMQDVLIDDAEGDIGEDLQRFLQQYPYFGEILVTDDAGRVVASTRSANNSRDLRGDTAFESARGGVDYQSVVGRSPLTDALGLTLAVPIPARYDPNVTIGALIGVIDWLYVETMLAEVSVAGGAQDGAHLVVLADRRDGHILYRTANAARQVERLWPNVRGVTEGMIAVEGRDYLVQTAHSRGRDGVEDPQWTVQTVLAGDIAFARIDDLARDFLYVAVAAAILAIVVGWFGANALVGPMLTMVTAMRKLAAGDTNVALPALRRDDELGAVAQALNTFKENAVTMTALRLQEAHLKRELKGAESASRAKSEFLAMVSHELRTPLNAIIGFSEMLKGQTFGPLGDRRYGEYAEHIKDSGDRLLEIINDILDWTKIDSGKDSLNLTNVDIVDLVRSVDALVGARADTQGLKLKIDCPPQPAIAADKRKLKQILSNLLSNAIKFTPKGGSVGVSVRRDSRGCVICVEDTGIGIAPEDIPKALAAFGQIDSDLNRKFEGTGLGLPLSKAFAEQHGGSLQLESKLGGGTRVTVVIPDKGQAAGSSQRAAAYAS
jgi:signal transduction histidine kinase